MRLFLALCLVCAFVAPAFADNFFDDFTDVIKGRNEDLPMRVYGAITIQKDKPVLNLLNADLRIKASTPLGDKFFEEGLIETGLEWKF